MAERYSTEGHDPLNLLRNGANLVLSVSGGKDSDAMSHSLLEQRSREGWAGRAVMVHADLGRAEWHTTPDYVKRLADRKKVDLHIVRRTAGDLIQRIWARWEAVEHKACPWPSPTNRYCTSDLKRGPIDTWLRNHFRSDATVICAQGLRAEESTDRAKALPVNLRTDASAHTKDRLVVDWLPIHEWKKADVWNCINTLGQGIYHPAYELGNQRLSCALCILGSENDLMNGAIHNPETYRELCRIEAVTGYSFKQETKKGVTSHWWLSDLKPELLPEETRQAIFLHKAAAVISKPIQLALM